MAEADLLLTGARFYYAPYGEALPSANTIGAGVAWGGNWVDGGVMSDPLTVAIEEERHQFKDNRYIAPIDEKRKSLVYSFKSALGEINAVNSALVQGFDPTSAVTTTAAGASQVGVEVFNPNAGGAACVRSVKKWAIGFEGIHCLANGTLLPIRGFLTKATFMSDGETVYDSEGDGVKLPFVATGFSDTAQPLGIPYRWERVTAAATS